MKEMVDWVIKLTKDGMLVWHKAERDVNEHSEEQRLKNAYVVSHFKPCIGKRFGGAYIGFRGKRKVLCAAIVDGVGNWHYLDARKELKVPVKNLFSLVRKGFLKKDICQKCGEIDADTKIVKEKELRKMVEAQARTIKSQKNHIARLKLHLACLGVDKKPFWKIKKD